MAGIVWAHANYRSSCAVRHVNASCSMTLRGIGPTVVSERDDVVTHP
jgi:hypothetical protein